MVLMSQTSEDRHTKEMGLLLLILRARARKRAKESESERIRFTMILQKWKLRNLCEVCSVSDTGVLHRL